MPQKKRRRSRSRSAPPIDPGWEDELSSLVEQIPESWLTETKEVLVGKLRQYSLALWDYNRTHRMLGTRSLEQFVHLHLRDCLGLLEHLNSPALDVGTGGGLPGLVLKCARPDLPLSLVEPRKKAAAFLSWMRLELKFQDLTVLNHRAEEVEPKHLVLGQAAQVLMSKGVGDVERLRGFAHHLLAPGGKILVLAPKEKPLSLGVHAHPHPFLAERRIHLWSGEQAESPSPSLESIKLRDQFL